MAHCNKMITAAIIGMVVLSIYIILIITLFYSAFTHVRSAFINVAIAIIIIELIFLYAIKTIRQFISFLITLSVIVSLYGVLIDDTRIQTIGVVAIVLFIFALIIDSICRSKKRSKIDKYDTEYKVKESIDTPISCQSLKSDQSVTV